MKELNGSGRLQEFAQANFRHLHRLMTGRQDCHHMHRETKMDEAAFGANVKKQLQARR